MSSATEREHVVVVCGGLNWDMISVGSRLPLAGETYNAQSFTQCCGGKGANTAIAVHRLSHKRPQGDGLTPDDISREHKISVRMIGSVGDKRVDGGFGERMIDSLKNRHFIDTTYVATQDGISSAVAVTWVERNGGQNRILVYPGANHKLGEDQFSDKSSFGEPSPDLVISQLELNPETVFQLLTVAKKAKIDTLLNPSPGIYIERNVYQGLTHLVLNESEAAIMTNHDLSDLEDLSFDWNRVTDRFLSLGVKNVVVTLGERGAFYSIEKGKGIRVPAQEVPKKEIADTSGAGDTFVGAYAVQYITRKPGSDPWDILSAVKHGCRAAARTIRKVGCQESVPWADELIPED